MTQKGPDNYLKSIQMLTVERKYQLQNAEKIINVQFKFHPLFPSADTPLISI